MDDLADAPVRAAAADVPPGTILNISGGSATALREVIDTVGLAVGAAVPGRYEAAQAGDVQRTDAKADPAQHLLGWEPSMPLCDGMARQVEQVAAQMGVAAAATSP